MLYALCNVPAAPVRKEASHRSEMMNQLLFGETMELLEEKGEWLRIRSVVDQYEGWITNHLITRIEKDLALEKHHYVANSLVNPITITDKLMNVPMGSFLTGYDEETRLLWDSDYKYQGTFRDISKSYNNDLLLKTVHAWINAPYLWGGKTFMGVDCSGFVQVVFRLMGIFMNRDAWQQGSQGEPVQNLDAAKQGDLAFFINDDGRIIHVGILLGQGKIIHASGKVRIDNIDSEGIINTDHGKRTHKLDVIRRMNHG